MTCDTANPPTPTDLSERERFGPDPQLTITANLAAVRQRIAAACVRANRDPKTIRLLPISKTVPSKILRTAFAAGIDSFGENKIQEALEKAKQLSDLDVGWSIVGHLQTNKVKFLTQFASELYSLDSLKLASALEKRLAAERRQLDVFIQVNTAEEESKYGVKPDGVSSMIERLSEFPQLRLRGLMTLAIFSAETEQVRKCFRILRELRDTLRDDLPSAACLDHLSMGMSGDFETAIEEGATIIRVGQAIFGARPGGQSPYWPGLGA